MGAPVKLRVMAMPADGFRGRHRAGQFFPARRWVDVEVDAAAAAAIRADKRLVVEEQPAASAPKAKG